jgi:hypothetical protein
VLGQFLATLCEYCADEHGLHHTVDEFWIYEFAKVRWKAYIFPMQDLLRRCFIACCMYHRGIYADLGAPCRADSKRPSSCVCRYGTVTKSDLPI